MPTLSVVLTVGQGSKVQTAVGRWLGLGRDATPTETETFLKLHLKKIVLETEKAAAASTVGDTFDTS